MSEVSRSANTFQSSTTWSRSGSSIAALPLSRSLRKPLLDAAWLMVLSTWETASADDPDTSAQPAYAAAGAVRARPAIDRTPASGTTVEAEAATIDLGAATTKRVRNSAEHGLPAAARRARAFQTSTDPGARPTLPSFADASAVPKQPLVGVGYGFLRNGSVSRLAAPMVLSLPCASASLTSVAAGTARRDAFGGRYRWSRWQLTTLRAWPCPRRPCARRSPRPLRPR